MIMRDIDKLLNSFVRRFANFINANTIFCLQYKPDFQTKLGKVDNFDRVYGYWTKQSPRNDKGDLVRLYFLLMQIDYIKRNDIQGSVADVGVYKGTTAKLFNDYFSEKKIHLFDTFSGFHEKDVAHEKETSGAMAGGWNTTLDAVKNFVGVSPHIFYYPGYFPDTTELLDHDDRYSLVHLDADLYQPQIAGLEYFYPKVSKGGVIILHDCNNEYSGSRKALDEFFANKQEVPVFIPDKSGSAIVIKL